MTEIEAFTYLVALTRIRKLEAALTEIAEWDAFFYPGRKDEIPKIAKRALESENP